MKPLTSLILFLLAELVACGCGSQESGGQETRLGLDADATDLLGETIPEDSSFQRDETAVTDADGAEIELVDNREDESSDVLDDWHRSDAWDADGDGSEGSCIPQCGSNECGDDGCGGKCGDCSTGLKCDSGKCVVCNPECGGKECGDDGCGSECGTCSNGLECGIDGKCWPATGGTCVMTGLQPGAAWPMDGYCPSRQGRSPAVGPSKPVNVWTIEGVAVSTPTIASDGTVYVGGADKCPFESPYGFHCANGLLRALNGEDGSTKWEATTERVVTSTAIGSDGTIYAATGWYQDCCPTTCTDGSLVAFKNDGSVKWEYTAGSFIDGSPVVGPSGVLYFGSGSKCSACYTFKCDSWTMNAVGSDGKSLWKREFANASSGTGAAIGADGRVCFGVDTKMICVTEAGEPIWEFDAADKPMRPVVGVDGTLYFGAGAKFFSLAPDGTLVWKFDVPEDSVRTDPAVSPDGSVVFGAGNTLFALTSAGQTKWTWDSCSVDWGVCGSMEPAPIIDANGDIFFFAGDVAPTMASLDSTGNVRWTQHPLVPHCGVGNPTGAAIGSSGELVFVYETDWMGSPDLASGLRMVRQCHSGCGSRKCGTDECGEPCGVCSGDGVCSADGDCFPTTGSTAIPLAIGQGTPFDLTVDEGWVYWTAFDDGTVVRIPKSGGTPTALAVAEQGPAGIAVDDTKVYWTDNSSYWGNVLSIAKESMDSFDSELVQDNQFAPEAIAVDSTAVYWTSLQNGTVMQLTHGAEVPITLASGQPNPKGMTTDASHVYWTTWTGGTVNSVPIGGGDVIKLATGQHDPWKIVVDTSFAYWTNPNEGTVYRTAKGGGGSPELLASGQQGPMGIVVDDSFIYWVDSLGGSVMRLSKSGAGSPVAVATGQIVPWALATDGAALYWTNKDGGTVVRMAK
jgi:hypothetical protein